MCRFTALAASVALAAAAFVGCGEDDGGESAGGGLAVVASFYPLAELAARIGGDAVEVTNLTAPGVEPHDIELTTRQVDQLEDADVVLYLGQDFQPAVEEIAERRDAGGVDLLDSIPGGAAGGDPHFWLDPGAMSAAAGVVAGVLAERAPPRAQSFRANATRYQADLAALEAEIDKGLADCDRREFVTAHAAFGHLARRYELEQVAIAGLSPEIEPDAGRLGEVADRIEASGITTVFFEELVSPDVAKALARETGASTGVLNPIEGLTDDQVAAGKDYAAVMRDNLSALRLALGCR